MRRGERMSLLWLSRADGKEEARLAKLYDWDEALRDDLQGALMRVTSGYPLVGQIEALKALAELFDGVASYQVNCLEPVGEHLYGPDQSS